ncbi:hypothetical protein ACIGXM_05320 [Kitasatospora sp. NPDC052896]|uniref:hypothetical protein n=1 Tax=Kitasatospora sp. NPDC052896 TaxID=3364061 RepID=UPI0037CBD733
MAIRRRRNTATAIALTAALTTGTALLLTACGPDAPTASAGASSSASAVPSGAPSAASTAPAPVSAQPSTVPTAPARPTGAPSNAGTKPTGTGSSGGASGGKPSSTPTSSAAAPSTPVNGTGGSSLTISNGTQYVLMNGTSVNFGTIVRDLAWSPDGSKAAFIDGSGNLDIANPNGSGRVTVAKNPGGQAWSHPTWQVAPADSADRLPAKNNIFFVSGQGAAAMLMTVPATSVNAGPTQLSLGSYPSDVPAPNPVNGNSWVNGGGEAAEGSTVYQNTNGDVYIRDDYLRQQGGVLTPGSEPALSPDGGEVVFVRSIDGHDHLFEQDLHSSGQVAKDLTPNATTDYTEPAWSPDGKTIAVRTPHGISTLPANGSAAPTQVSTSTGLPAYRG